MDITEWLKNGLIEDYVNKKVATVHLSEKYDLVVYVVHKKEGKDELAKT